MFRITRWSPMDDVFNFQRQVDRAFDQLWSDLPARTAAGSQNSFQVNALEDGWRVDIPLPGIDPRHVTLEVAGNTLSIRAQEPGVTANDAGPVLYEQTLTVPQFLDIQRLRASHRHGMLQLTFPLKESVKPRRIEIENVEDEQKQLTTA